MQFFARKCQAKLLSSCLTKLRVADGTVRHTFRWSQLLIQATIAAYAAHAAHAANVTSNYPNPKAQFYGSSL